MSNRMIIFNDKVLPSFFKVKHIKCPVLPPIEGHNADGSIKFGKKNIAVECVVNKRGQLTQYQSDALIDFLSVSKGMQGKLYLYNDKNYFYNACITSDIDFNNIGRSETTIVFECEPYRIGKHDYTITNENIDYNGIMPTYPKLSIKVKSACSEIVFSVTNSKYTNRTIILRGVFNANDIIEINQSTNKITQNGVLKMGMWDLKSKRHKLYQGLNAYEVIQGSVEITKIYNINKL